MAKERPTGAPVDLTGIVELAHDAEFVSVGREDGSCDHYSVIDGQAYLVGQG